MFKNAFIYRLMSSISAPVHMTLQEAFGAHAFVPCGATQEKSSGWVPPRGHEHGQHIESIDGQWILKLMTEVKAVPASAIKTRVDKWKKEVEANTGRKPGKKETREQQDDIRIALLPMAFPKQVATTIWIDTATSLMVIDAGSQARVDDALTALINSIEGLAVQLVNTQQAPASAMAEWLSEKASPLSFTVDRECELKACDESKATIKYGRHALDIDEVVDHIAQGMMPTRLALTFKDRVSFVLTEGLQLKKIAILDVAMESHKDGHQDAFDADVAIATAELKKMLPALFDALGGQVVA